MAPEILRTRIPDEYLDRLTARMVGNSAVTVPAPVLTSIIEELAARRRAHPVAVGENIGEDAPTDNSEEYVGYDLLDLVAHGYVTVTTSKYPEPYFPYVPPSNEQDPPTV